MAGNGIKPGAESVFLVVLIKVGKCPAESNNSQILGILRMYQLFAQEGLNAVPIFIQQLCKGTFVAFQCALNKL